MNLKWWYSMKWWIGSEYDELLEIEWLVDNWLICGCCWEWCECGICWVEKWDIEIWWWLKNDWAIVIVDWKFVEMDWNDELCELFMFDGNELVVVG